MLELLVIVFVLLGSVGSTDVNIGVGTAQGRAVKQCASVFLCRDFQVICLGTTGSQAKTKTSPFLFSCRDTLFSLKTFSPKLLFLGLLF